MLLDKERSKVLENLKAFDLLSQCRNLDFPNNTLYICATNLEAFSLYYENVVLTDDYRIKLDYILVTHIINYLSSVKSYLNRKKRAIERTAINGNYKNGLLMIFEKYWKAKRLKTNIDKVIKLRDKFEHEKISGISLHMEMYEDRIEKTLMINETNINKLFIDSFNDLKILDQEINLYIESELRKLNLRHCCLFMNAFNRAYGKNPYIKIFPEETKEEIDHYDKLICALKEMN